MSLKNGHAQAKIPSQSPGAIRMRRSRDRRKRGAVVLQAEIEATMIEALISCGWLHSLERDDRVAVTSAIGAIVYQALNGGMQPAQPGKAFVPVDLQALQAAWPWARPGSPVTPENVGQAIANVAKCSALVGFGPSEFGNRLMRMVEERAV